jgi:chromate transporter
VCYAGAGALAAALVGPWLVLVMIGTGLLEIAIGTSRMPLGTACGAAPLPLAAVVPAAGGLLALSWVAFKVGALSYGGGFVITP